MDSQTKTTTTAIGVAVVLSYFWTPLRDFWFENFFAPLLADARGVPVNGVTATYNTYNTILYAFLFYIGYLIIRNLLKKWKIKIDDNFMFATFPLIVAGGVIRVLEDAGHFEEPLQYFFISPLIYLTLAAFSIGALWLGKLIKKVKSKDHKRLVYSTYLLLTIGYFLRTEASDQELASPASFALMLGVLFYLFNFKWASKPLKDSVLFFKVANITLLMMALLQMSIYELQNPTAIPDIILSAVGLTVAIFFITYTSPNNYKQYGQRTPLILYFAHLLDAKATWLGIQEYGYAEKHVLPTFLIEEFGTAFVMIPLKIIVVTVALWMLFSIKDDDDDPQAITLLMMFLITLGLAPGVRDMLRIALGT
tara:strand:+ start:2659 stop:3753 length:1095 start_codon:yes stop_codon:yes gene_type:complete